MKSLAPGSLAAGHRALPGAAACAFGVSVLHFRVWPHDIDTNLHMNNGRYLTIADLGRTDLLLRMGLIKLVLKEGLQPMLSGSAIRYRRELKPFQAFRLESCILGWRGTSFIMQHRFVVKGKDGEDQTAASRWCAAAYDKKPACSSWRRTLAQAVGYEGDSPGTHARPRSVSRGGRRLRRR